MVLFSWLDDSWSIESQSLHFYRTEGFCSPPTPDRHGKRATGLWWCCKLYTIVEVHIGRSDGIRNQTTDLQIGSPTSTKVRGSNHSATEDILNKTQNSCQSPIPSDSTQPVWLSHNTLSKNPCSMVVQNAWWERYTVIRYILFHILTWPTKVSLCLSRCTGS